MARVLVYWTYKVSKFGYGRTKWMVTMYSKYTAHINSNGSHFLTAWFLVYWTYKVCSWYAPGYYRVYKLKWKPLFSGCFLGPYKVSKIGYGLFSYALQPAKRTSASFTGAILKEYLVKILYFSVLFINYDNFLRLKFWKNLRSFWCTFFFFFFFFFFFSQNQVL